MVRHLAGDGLRFHHLDIAALAGVDPSLYEAARIDGASRWKKIIHIDLPSLIPITVIMLILSLGKRDGRRV